VGGRDNDAAAWIEEAGGGWIVPEDDVPALLRAVEEARDPQERHRRGQAGLRFAREHFAGARNSTRIAELLEECVAASGSGAHRRQHDEQHAQGRDLEVEVHQRVQ
jgi:hypothetical protein